MSIKKPDEYGQILDEYEQKIEDSITGNVLPPEEAEKIIAMLRQGAFNNQQKKARIGLSITKSDLNALKNIATEKGLKYQTFISNILHEFVEKHAT